MRLNQSQRFSFLVFVPLGTRPHAVLHGIAVSNTY